MKHAPSIYSRRTSGLPGGAANPHDASLVAGVLIGGQSRRFGSPKALLPMPGGGTLVEHVVGVAQRVAGRVVLLGRATALPASLACLTVLPDDPRGAGPAAGLSALLQYVSEVPVPSQARAKRWALLLSCDLPRLGPGALAPLLAAPRDAADAVACLVANGGGKLEACCALYHSRLLPLVRRALVADGGCMQRLLAAVRVVTAALPAESRDALCDIDTPQDAARLLTGRIPGTPLLAR